MMRTVTITIPGGTVVQLQCQIHELADVIKQVRKSEPATWATADLLTGIAAYLTPEKTRGST